jgi:hypothetical protein
MGQHKKIVKYITNGSLCETISYQLETQLININHDTKLDVN